MRLFLSAIAFVLIASGGCGKDEKKRQRVDEEETGSKSALSLDDSAKKDSSRQSERRIEDLLVEHSRTYDKEIRISRISARSVQCGTVTVPVDASFGDVLMALTVQGVRVTMSDRHLSITGAISSIKGCEKERRKDRYTIARGEIRDPEKDLAPDVLTSPDPSGAPRGAVLAIEPPVQKGPFEWVMTDATAAEARRAGWQWLMKSEKASARVPAIPPGSLAGKLGLVEGDVILSLNGYSLTDPDTTVEAYAKTARGKAFVLTVERAGKKLDLKYAVE